MEKRIYIIATLCFCLMLSVLAFAGEFSHNEQIVLIESSFNLQKLPASSSLLHDFGDLIVVKADATFLRLLEEQAIKHQVLSEYSDDIYLTDLSPKTDTSAIDRTEEYRSLLSAYGSILYTHQPSGISLYRLDDAVNVPDAAGRFKLIPLSIVTTDTEYHSRTINYNQEVLTGAEIAEISSSLDVTRYEQYVQHLQDYQTRYFLHPNRREIVKWMQDEFLSFGFTEVVIDSFFIEDYNWGNFPPSWQYNLIATLRGTKYPDNYILIGGHYDSIISPHSGNAMETAPGVDDNASGVAAMLEIARVLTENDYAVEKSFKFIPFGAEEIGLYGSRDIAEKFAADKLNIEIVVNNDMIANKQEDDVWKVKIFPYSGHLYLSDLSTAIFEDFTTLTPDVRTINNPNSDSYCFWQQGFPAVFFHEYDFSSVYHSPDDTIEHCDFDYALEITKASLLTMLYMDRIPVPVPDILIYDKGCGTEVVVTYQYPLPGDIDYFNIAVSKLNPDGTVEILPVQQSDHFNASISGLTEGNDYFFAVSAVNKSGFESILTEKQFTPQAIPRTPQSFSLTAGRDNIELFWQENPELDIAGYNIYRSSEPVLPSQPFVSLHTENSYRDDSLTPNRHYYYAITAVDNDNNESVPTRFLKTGLFSLDQGILIVNTTPQGTGEPFFPSEREVFYFYDSVLARYQNRYLLLNEEDALSIADIGFYSTVLLFNDSIRQTNHSFAELFGEYLAGGGKLIVSGFHPVSFFPDTISQGDLSGSLRSPSYESRSSLLNDFSREHLGIDSLYHHFGSFFNEAVSTTPDFPSLSFDSNRFNENFNHLLNIYGFTPAADGEAIYLYGSPFPQETSAGSMSAAPVGIKTDNTLTLSFPLFYLQQEVVAAFLHRFLSDNYSEESFQPENTKHRVHLLPNYPNPFNSETTIPFFLQHAGDIELSLYNIQGRKITTIFRGYKDQGRHTILWQEASGINSNLASGIYIVALKQDKQTHQRKIILLQ